MSRFVLLLLFPAALPAQWISVGVKGGVPASDAFETVRTANLSYLSDTKRYLVGGTFEVRLPLGLGVEFDALYRRLNYETTAGPGGFCPTCGPSTASTSANSWEFPLLLKLRAASPAVRPFVAGGPSFRALSDVRQFITDPLGRRETGDPAELSNRASTGLTLGAGLELGGRFRFVPEVRYTRWGWENFQSPALPQFRNNQNQVDVLVGIHY